MTELEKNPAVIEVTDGIMALEAFAQTYQVTTPAQYETGAADLQRVKGMQKKLEETRTGITKPMNAALDRVNEFFKGPKEKLASIEQLIRRKLTNYHEDQERIRREEQRKADEKAAEDRRRADAAAAEARRKAEAEAVELRRKAETEAAAGRQAQAAKLQQRAESKVEKADIKAAALEQTSAAVVAPVIQRAPPKVAGLTAREVWKFVVDDPSRVPREYLAVDETAIRKVVQALKGNAKIPGVRIYPEKQLASGAA